MKNGAGNETSPEDSVLTDKISPMVHALAMKCSDQVAYEMIFSRLVFCVCPLVEVEIGRVKLPRIRKKPASPFSHAVRLVPYQNPCTGLYPAPLSAVWRYRATYESYIRDFKQ